MKCRSQNNHPASGLPRTFLRARWFVKRVLGVALLSVLLLGGCPSTVSRAYRGDLQLVREKTPYGLTINALAMATYVPAYVAYALMPEEERPQQLFTIFL